jgi:hypothetical protein
MTDNADDRKLINIFVELIYDNRLISRRELFERFKIKYKYRFNKEYVCIGDQIKYKHRVYIPHARAFFDFHRDMYPALEVLFDEDMRLEMQKYIIELV